jgi:hypothetical protein
MENRQKRKVIKATLAELIAVLAEEAFFLAGDETETTVLVATMLDDLFDQPDTKVRRWQ